MNPNKTTAIMLCMTVMLMVSIPSEASPQRHGRTVQIKTQLELSAAQLARQTAEMEHAYQRLLEIKKRLDVVNKKAAMTKVIYFKGQIVKTSFTPADIPPKKAFDKRLKVTATAYTSHVNQTDSTPNIAAWGDRLKPGMKVIAVSRDLLTEHGLKHRQKVRIKGLEGEYVVLDKMNKRWRKKIDIYMGMDKRKALRWGRRKVEILWDS